MARYVQSFPILASMWKKELLKKLLQAPLVVEPIPLDHIFMISTINYAKAQTYRPLVIAGAEIQPNGRFLLARLSEGEVEQVRLQGTNIRCVQLGMSGTPSFHVPGGKIAAKRASGHYFIFEVEEND